MFVAQFCEEQVPCVINISGIIKNFADLKRRTVNVTLKVPFVEFVEVPDGNYFRLVSRERGRKNDKSEDYSKADQNNVYRWRMP